ncbi:MAG: hypothetical protein A2041_10405 [Bacteroidetes bacterium GWA2_31_9b]|nr:MAG: hypothetical protein A2041_10405 [Bacteroidetes bacterium GWA2_31_9b]
MKSKKTFVFIFIIIVLISFGFFPYSDFEIFITFEKRLKSYFLKNTTEKVYLHTDKDIYQLGDTLWFKAYTTKYNNERSTNSQILTINLYNDKNEEVFQKFFKYTYGVCSGDFKVPLHLNDGDYRLVAYTNYMKNIDSTNLYSKTIRIFENKPKFKLVIKQFTNYFNPGDSIDISLLAVTNDNQTLDNIPVEISLLTDNKNYEKKEVVSSKKGNISIRLKIPEKDIEEQLFIEAKSNYQNYNVSNKIKVPLKSANFLFRFFPEGGELINGVNNHIAFEVYDDFKNPVEIIALLKDQNNYLLDTIKTAYSGLGAFNLISKPGFKYHIEIIKPHKILNLIGIPEFQQHGIALKVNYQELATISIDLNASDSLKMLDVFGVLYSGNTIFWSQPINLRSQNQVIIPINKIPEGIAQFTVFNENYIPIAERLIYIPSNKKMKIEISTNKEKYHFKDKVNIEVTATDNQGKPVSANFSLAVVDESAIIPDNFNHIVIYNLLEGELSENISDNFALNTYGINKDYVDLLLLTKGWRRFKWDRIIKTDYLENVTEENKKFISGNVLNYRGKPIKNANVQLFNPSKLYIENAITDEYGKFYFSAKNYLSVADTSEITIIGSRKNGENDLDIFLDDNYSKELKNYFSIDPDKTRISYNSEYDSILYSQNYEDYYKNFDNQTILIEEISVTANRIVKIPVATKRKVFQEISLKGENIGFIASSSDGQGSFIDVLSKMTTNFKTVDYKILFRGYNSLGGDFSGALIVVDGLPMGEDIRILDNFNVNDIESVNIVKNPSAALKYQGGHLGGLIEIKMKESKTFTPKEKISIYKNKLNFAGYSISREFYSPIYKTDEEKLLSYDTRNTLYWNPNLIINESGKSKISFYTSDEKMKVKIICEGMNFNKLAGHGEAEFIVY